MKRQHEAENIKKGHDTLIPHLSFPRALEDDAWKSRNIKGSKDKNHKGERLGVLEKASFYHIYLKTLSGVYRKTFITVLP